MTVWRRRPIDGKPVELGIAIASADALKADGTAARAMGLDPEDIGYMTYMQAEGLGNLSLEELVGETIESVKKDLGCTAATRSRKMAGVK